MNLSSLIIPFYYFYFLYIMREILLFDIVILIFYKLFVFTKYQEEYYILGGYKTLFLFTIQIP